MARKKLLIVHHGALGDVVVTFPALIRLRPAFGKIDALFQGVLGKLAADLNVVDNWFAIEAAVFATLYCEPVDPALKNFLRSYDRIILFSYSEQLQETILKTTKRNVDRIPPQPHADQCLHVCRHIFAHFTRCGLMEDKDEGCHRPLPEVKSVHVRNRGYDPDQVLIHPGSGSKRKNWPAANFVKTAKILESKGIPTQFILGPADHHLVDFITATKSLLKKVQIVKDLEKLTALLRTALGFIGNDSGVAHLAGFLGVPTLTVFGPSDPQRWRPMGPIVKVVRPVLDCRPCFEKSPMDCHTMECLNQTFPQDVAAAFQKLTDYSTSFPSCQYSLVDPPLAQV